MCLTHGVCCRFLCREQLGGSKFTGAAFLKPVPEDAVVYGSGEQALVLTKVSSPARLLPQPTAQRRFASPRHRSRAEWQQNVPRGRLLRIHDSAGRQPPQHWLTASVPVQEQARLLHMTSLAGYKQLKDSVLATTLSLVATGTVTLWGLSGSQCSVPFALGGVAGLAYQYLLQRRIDAVGGATGPQQARPAC